MRTLHIIVPMAGEGSRFLNQGFVIPKPLILFKGKTLFERSIGSIEGINAPKKYTFIVRQEHIDKYKIDQELKAVFPTANIFSIIKSTRGAVETCLLAKDVIASDDAVIVIDCDLEFTSKQFNEKIKEVLSQPATKVNGGVLVSFQDNNPRYSYAELDDRGVVIRTAEKEPISNHALAGAYFFSRAESFLYAANKLLSDPNYNKPEFYVSLLFNYLIARGEIVYLAKTDSYYSYGTPEELNRYAQ